MQRGTIVSKHTNGELKTHNFDSEEELLKEAIRLVFRLFNGNVTKIEIKRN